MLVLIAFQYTLYTIYFWLRFGLANAINDN
jgi:hypothetical protein